MASSAQKAEKVTVEENKAQKQGTVIEEAAGRISWEERFEDIHAAINMMSKDIAKADERNEQRFEQLVKETNRKITELRDDQHEVHKGLQNDLRQLARVPVAEPATRQHSSVKVERNVEEDESSWLGKAWRNTKKTVTPRKPSNDTLQGAIYANLAEYIALVAAAQVAPVWTLNTISSALFIA